MKRPEPKCKKKSAIILAVAACCIAAVTGGIFFFRTNREDTHRGRLSSEQRLNIQREIDRRMKDMDADMLRQQMSAIEILAGRRLRSEVADLSPDDIHQGLDNAFDDIQGLHDFAAVMMMVPAEHRAVLVETMAGVMRTFGENMTEMQKREVRNYRNSPEGRRRIKRWRRTYLREIPGDAMKAINPIIFEINRIVEGS